MKGQSNTTPQPSAPLTARFYLRSSSNLTSSHLLSAPWRPPSPSVASPAVTCSVSTCCSVLNGFTLPAQARFHTENQAKCSLLPKILPVDCPGLPASSRISTKRAFMLGVRKCCRKWPFLRCISLNAQLGFPPGPSSPFQRLCWILAAQRSLRNKAGKESGIIAVPGQLGRGMDFAYNTVA